MKKKFIKPNFLISNIQKEIISTSGCPDECCKNGCECDFGCVCPGIEEDVDNSRQAPIRFRN